MANEKISDMPVASLPLSGTEKVEIVQGSGPGSNKQTTVQDIANLGGGGGGTVQSVTGSTVDNTDPTNPIVNADAAGAAATAESNANAYSDTGDAFVQEYAEGLVANSPAKKTMDVVSTVALPSYVATPGSGSTRTILTASVNGAFPTTDSITVGSITSVLVAGETAGNAKYNGPYELIQAGSAGTKWILQRTKDSQASLSSLPVDLAEVSIKQGSTYASHTFRQQNINVTVDTDDQLWEDITIVTTESIAGKLFMFNNFI